MRVDFHKRVNSNGFAAAAQDSNGGFAWQEEHGAFSVSVSQPDKTIESITRQPSSHIPILNDKGFDGLTIFLCFGSVFGKLKKMVGI
jgi:hypothetical protein